MNATKERARLAEAIELANEAQKFVDEARRAARNAQAKWSDASGKVGALTRELEEAEEHVEDSADALIAGLASGEVDVLDKPRTKLDELRKELENAEAESAVWHDAIKIAEVACEVRQHALDLARSRVDEAARQIVDAELNVSAMLARAEAARQSTLRESATLLSVARMLPQASLGRQAIESFMQQGWHSPNAVERSVGGESYREWFDALCADASATMS